MKINMKSVMFAIVSVIVLLLTFGAAFGQTNCTTGCCDSSCTGNNRNSTSLDVNECVVRVNDRVIKNDVVVLKAFERGEELELKVEFTSSQDAEDVQVATFMTGYHRGDRYRNMIFDISSAFDIEANVSYEKTLLLKLPDDFEIDTGDELKIRVVISDKFSATYIREYNLKVDAMRHNMVIQDIVLDPATKVQAGRGLFASVRVKNFGEDTEESLKITVSLPALDIKATEYIDELETDEATTSEDMFLRIPSCTKPGDYVVKAEVTFADGDEVVTKQTTITITEDDECSLVKPGTGTGKDEKTVITVPGKQDVVKGTVGTAYPVIIENTGVTDRSYQISVGGIDSWASYRLDPGSYIVVKAGQTQTVYVYITPKADSVAGEKIFTINIETANDKKQVALTANVVEGQSQEKPFNLDFGNYKQLMIMGIIGLVVLAIILLVLIGLTKTKGKEDDEVPGQTYY